MAERYDFDSPKGLLAVANRKELHASEKPLFVYTKGDGDFRLSESDSGTRMKAEKLDDFKLVYNEHTNTKFGAVTDDYQIINPPEFVGPLAAELRDRNHENINGSVWVRNGGAQAYARVLLEDKHNVWLPNRGRSNPVRVGFSFRWSHDGGISVRASGFAQDTQCTNSIRQVTSPVHVKHAGDVEDRVDWESEWQNVLDDLGAFSEALANIIEDAQNFDALDLRDSNNRQLRDASDPPTSIDSVETFGPITETDRAVAFGFYSLAGFPDYLAVAATDRLFSRLAAKDDPTVASAWDVHSAGTYALTHHGRGTPGASDDRYHRVTAEMLMNPAKAVEDARMEAMSELEPETGQGIINVEDREADTEELGDALRQYEERSRALEAAFGGE
jgi:hypothetical protein